MIPSAAVLVCSLSSFPRVSGDDPTWQGTLIPKQAFSPRERG